MPYLVGFTQYNPPTVTESNNKLHAQLCFIIKLQDTFLVDRYSVECYYYRQGYLMQMFVMCDTFVIASELLSIYHFSFCFIIRVSVFF